jgi:hypothetical protein
VGFVRSLTSRGVVAVDRTLCLSLLLPYWGRVLIEPLPLAAAVVLTDGLLGACGAGLTVVGDSLPKIRCVIDPGVVPGGLAYGFVPIVWGPLGGGVTAFG